MSDLPSGLHPGMRASFIMPEGTVLTGEIEQAARGWVRLRGDTGVQFVQLAHVAMVKPLVALRDERDDEGGLPKPTSKERPVLMGAQAPGRPWRDEELRALADGFLDGVIDSELAARHHRTRSAVRELRQGFECARGNLVEDQISQVARTWVDRWRRVLAG